MTLDKSIQILNNFLSSDELSEQLSDALKNVLDTCTKLLAVGKIMPEKMEYDGATRNWMRTDDYIAGFNEALDLCLTAISARLPSLKEIENLNVEVHCPKCGNGKYFIGITEATAIHALLLKSLNDGEKK